jgi:long-chain acyl-CoA synthetase
MPQQDLKKLMPQARATIHTPVAVETPGLAKVDGETIPRRNVKAQEKLVLAPSDGVNTLYDVLRYSAKTFGNAKAVGSRKIVNVHTETKKIKKMVDGKETEVDKNWQYYELSPYEYKSFNEFERVCLELGSGLKQLGFQPEDRLHLYAATSAQWLSSAHGMFCPVSGCVENQGYWAAPGDITCQGTFG